MQSNTHTDTHINAHMYAQTHAHTEREMYAQTHAHTEREGERHFSTPCFIYLLGYIMFISEHFYV